jgi:hypothetical protein
VFIQPNLCNTQILKKTQKTEQKESLPVLQETKNCYLPSYKTISAGMSQINFKGQSTSRQFQEEMCTYGSRMPIGDKLLSGFEFKSGFGEVLVVDYENDKTLNKFIDEFEDELNKKKFTNGIKKLKFIMDFVNEKFDPPVCLKGETLTNYMKYNTPAQMTKLRKKYDQNPKKLYEELIKSKKHFESSHGFDGYFEPETKDQFAKWKIGDVIDQRQGVCRHKALLVKILCDKVLSKLPQKIESSVEIGIGHVWNTIKYNNKFLVLGVEEHSLILINDNNKKRLDWYVRALRKVGEQTPASTVYSTDSVQHLYTNSPQYRAERIHT